ncbi:MAG TPA: DoxX family protein [Terracidiphilus sp.]|nr:DoxX family protein [Terracidiphilus sp.]
MHRAYLIVVILAASLNIYAATSDFTRPAWILGNMKTLGIEERWLPALGLLKALGALGLLAGIVIPWIGVAAAAGLVLFFVCAMAAALRVRWYAHLPFPLVWMVLVGASLVLRLRSS